MPRRTWTSLAMLATGGALLVAAQFAGAASHKQGGIFKIGTSGASVQIDPQLAYTSTAWGLEYATAAKLYDYTPTGRLVPEVVSRFKVSNGGRRYTFFIRKGFRFSDGSRVTAASFKYAINRVANHDVASPGAAFITDPNGVDIVGAEDVSHGNGTNVQGVRARGQRLVIDMTGEGTGLVSVLTMPFFQATSAKLPRDREVVDVRSMSDLPSAGPYVFALNDPNRLTQLRRNPFWSRGPGRSAKPKVDGVDLQWNLDEREAFEMVKASRLDEGPLPRSEIQSVADQYGVNRSRFWVEPTLCLGYLPFNNSRLFADNPQLRKAVNWALDRTAYAAQSGGPYAQTPWTHFLPPGVPGSVTKRALQPYGLTPDLTKARELAAGHYKDGRVVVAYRTSGSGPARADVVRRNLTDLGLNVVMRPVLSTDVFPPAEWDILSGFGWCSNLPDPGAMLSGFAYVYGANAQYLQKLRAAEALSGSKRLRAFGMLDLEIAKNLAPAAAMHTYNNRFFFSARVDSKSLTYHHVYQDWSIPALALK